MVWRIDGKKERRWRRAHTQKNDSIKYFTIIFWYSLWWAGSIARAPLVYHYVLFSYIYTHNFNESYIFLWTPLEKNMGRMDLDRNPCILNNSGFMQSLWQMMSERCVSTTPSNPLYVNIHQLKFVHISSSWPWNYRKRRWILKKMRRYSKNGRAPHVPCSFFIDKMLHTSWQMAGEKKVGEIIGTNLRLAAVHEAHSFIFLLSFHCIECSINVVLTFVVHSGSNATKK